MTGERSIFFDLDGTLTDPYVGIHRCIEYALQSLGEPTGDDYHWAVGPPLRQSFSELVGESRADKALSLYRERYADVGWAENEPYPDVHDALSSLHNERHRLFVATSKPHVFARQILEHFDLLQFFNALYGAELDGTRGDKPSLLAYALAEQKETRNAIMVGDRRYDIEGARANGMQAWGVLYGFGTQDELEATGADGLLHRTTEFGRVVQ